MHYLRPCQVLEQAIHPGMNHLLPPCITLHRRQVPWHALHAGANRQLRPDINLRPCQAPRQAVRTRTSCRKSGLMSGKSHQIHDAYGRPGEKRQSETGEKLCALRPVNFPRPSAQARLVRGKQARSVKKNSAPRPVPGHPRQAVRAEGSLLSEAGQKPGVPFRAPRKAGRQGASNLSQAMDKFCRTVPVRGRTRPGGYSISSKTVWSKSLTGSGAGAAAGAGGSGGRAPARKGFRSTRSKGQ